MKNSEQSGCCNIGFGILIGLFGVFFLIANLMPEHREILKFWPIFMIAGGALKAWGGWCCKRR